LEFLYRLYTGKFISSKFMFQPFLKLVAEHIHRHYKDNVEKLCIVLPNKRGSIFLKQHLGEVFGKTIWLPAIISAEDLIAEFSGVKTIEELDLMCHLYESYKICYGPKAETFDSFAKWGHLILQDFNEIDRYLADPQQLYENLKDIKEIENWSLSEESLSEFQVNYLEFMASLGAIYQHFSAFLLKNNWAYQGLAYRQAVLNLQSSNFPSQFHKMLFCGFNALNAAEIKIINYLHIQKKAELLWDADDYYLHNKQHEAGLFLRNNFKLFPQKEQHFVGQHFAAEKQIEIVSVPKQIGQAQVVRQTLQKYIDEQIPMDKVAVVLANEKLLWPVLQQIPQGVEHVNITMEYPLRYTSTYALVDSLLQIQVNYSKQNKKNKHLYHLDLVALLKQPLFNTLLLATKSKCDINQIINGITLKNISFISEKQLNGFFGNEAPEIIPYLKAAANAKALCSLLIECLQQLHQHFVSIRENNRIYLELEYLEIIMRNLNRLSEVLLQYPHFEDIKSFRQLFSQVVGNSTAPFIGEPLKGLQLMGVLETRTLDFEYLILVNVNESVLPAGKSVNSFIPNDLKRAFGLPLYLEKDAIYAYHFYRLLQRAKNITITYDSETDTLGKGEKSRFITQLQLELSKQAPLLKISESAASAAAVPSNLTNIISIEKTDSSLEKILKKSLNNDTYSGLSPSSLIVYKECSLKFYFRYAAGLKEIKQVEESAEANTFGSILHLSLEKLYKDFVGEVLDGVKLKKQLQACDAVVKEAFKHYFDTDELSGKNILQFEVIKAYCEKMLKSDIRAAENLALKNQQLNILQLEAEFSSPIAVNIDGVTNTVFVKGKIDRIDNEGKNIRIIDYKNSVKDSDKFVFKTYEDLFEKEDYNKQFQLIMYAWLLYKNNFCRPEQMLPAVIPFKKFLDQPIFLKSEDKQTLQLTQDFLHEFEKHLQRFIENIFDRKQNFLQTQDLEICKFCDYLSICNR
jgi:ATP-dependent helicase/nuclease subunit B